MRWWIYEWRLLVRSQLALGALLLLLLLSALAVVAGLDEVARQQQTISRLAELQQHDLQLEMQRHLNTEGKVAGSAASHIRLGTWNPPGAMAFSALGLRDTAPWALRVRMYALQSQLHEDESFHPELALTGRFDFAFVLVYLVPLLLIALLHDVVSGERQSGRLSVVLSLPETGVWGRALWLRRAGLRTLLAFVGLVIPVLVGSIISGATAGMVLSVLWIVAAYMLFWAGLTLWVAVGYGSSVRHATVLMGWWVVLTLILPTAANAVMQRVLPVRQGVDMMLAQHHTLHSSWAWEQTRAAIMTQFFASHPEWQHTAPVPESAFGWKWHYALHQVADDRVAEQVLAWRDSLYARQHWNDRLGWLLPGVGVQVALHRQAGTDLPAHLAYQDEIAALHTRLRHFFYPYVFNEQRFEAADFAGLPQFTPAERHFHTPLASLAALGVLAGLMLLLGVRAAGGVRMHPAVGVLDAK